jgi:hypothetical protein
MTEVENKQLLPENDAKDVEVTKDKFVIPLGAKIGFIALLIVAAVVIVAIVFIKKEQQKSKTLQDTIEKFEECRDEDRAKIQELTLINNKLNNDVVELTEREQKRVSVGRNMTGDLDGTMPTFDGLEEKNTEPVKKITKKEEIQKLMNQKRTTAAQAQTRREQAIQDAMEAETDKMREQVQQLTNTKRSNDEPEDEQEDDEDIPISTIDKNIIH